jgi:DNA-binding XRE family transcriptional regulator
MRHENVFPLPGSGGQLTARRAASIRLRRLRCELGLAQEDMAALCGVTRRTVGAWERAEVSLGPLEAMCILELELNKRRRAA